MLDVCRNTHSTKSPVVGASKRYCVMQLLLMLELVLPDLVPWTVSSTLVSEVLSSRGQAAQANVVNDDEVDVNDTFLDPPLPWQSDFTGIVAHLCYVLSVVCARCGVLVETYSVFILL
jgi:hypothetical protein